VHALKADVVLRCDVIRAHSRVTAAHNSHARGGRMTKSGANAHVARAREFKGLCARAIARASESQGICVDVYLLRTLDFSRDFFSLFWPGG
jgi:hypothetical protein